MCSLSVLGAPLCAMPAVQSALAIRILRDYAPSFGAHNVDASLAGLMQNARAAGVAAPLVGSPPWACSLMLMPVWLADFTWRARPGRRSCLTGCGSCPRRTSWRTCATCTPTPPPSVMCVFYSSQNLYAHVLVPIAFLHLFVISILLFYTAGHTI